MVIGGVQAPGSLTVGLSITDPTAMLVGTLIALVAEAELVIATSTRQK